ncbi:MAG: twin-arginine translocase subunit TatC [Eggerthellaceae bacterium]|jgi:sec-independent protein translocase protein TatC|nr:twin-arginine translocase subunit TatC [Eggerthellaceae bacterium]MDR2721500.1 twin-arginine translocase subunit TatC [Coriobacteriaceae bacterium]
MPVGPARMPLFDHLGELRMRVVRILVCLVVAVFIFYLAAPKAAHFLLEPVLQFMPQTEEGTADIFVFGAFDAFALRFFVSLWMSIVACMPVILWQLLAFFLPALKPKERKWFIPTFATGVALFIFGTVFCYLVILAPAFEWMTDQAGGLATIYPEAKQWIDLIIKFEIGFGIAFELPLIIFYLVIFDVLPYKRLRSSWRTVYIALMVISAMVTPDASPVTMLLMFAAMLGLYEASLLVARVALGKRIKQQTADWEAKKAEDEKWEKEWAEERAAKKKALKEGK